jgi:HTH-type transcriptional regulator/antitoxin HigA
VLVHELVHVKSHLKKGRVEEIFDDLDAEADSIEREADEQAGQALISDELWETALARYLRTEESIRTFAEETRISEAIISGRIRKEADNYIMLKELIGIGQVRRFFPEVKFGQ